MTTVLVIESNRESRQIVQRAASSEWKILEAPDGLSGLEMARRHLQQIDLIVLALDLPDIDGLVVCVRLREISPIVPILPVADSTAALQILTELGCLPAVLKPARFSALQSALWGALHQPAPPIASSAMLGWAQEQCRLIEQRAHHARRTLRVAVFTTSHVKRAGLARILGITAEVSEVLTLTALRLLLAGGRFTALVTDAADYRMALPIAREYGLPVILIAATLEQSQTLHTLDVATVVVESDQMAPVRLALAIEAIDNGDPQFAHQMEITGAAQHGRTVPPALSQRFAETPLSTREQEVLWLDFQGMTTTQIAHYLAISTLTVGSHWKGAQRKMQMRRSILRAWVHMLMSQS